MCDQAAVRISACTGAPSSPAQVAACRDDPPTVRLYEACLAEPDCAGFLRCLSDVVDAAIDADRRAAAAATPGATRAERCAAYIERAKRGIALQVVVGERDDPSDGRACLLGTAPLDDCLTRAEARVVKRYVRFRQEDCEAWPEPLAACVLGLPHAVDCDPDAFPLWRDRRRLPRFDR